MSFKPRVWSCEGELHGPLGYLRYMDLDTTFRSPTYADARTLHLVNYVGESSGRADISINGLLLKALREGDSIAQAVQCMLMGVLASRYQLYQFVADGNDTISRRADFSPVQVPGGHGQPASSRAGATQSYLVIMTPIAAYCLNVIIIFIWFCRGRSTRNERSDHGSAN